MKKSQYIIGLIILGCISGTFAVFALVPNLFPDTPQFPRVDTSPGTLGAIFQKLLGPGFAWNGTLPNTTLLGGKTPTDYLKNKTCTDTTEVWVSVLPG
jgi:hypothetical protein